MPQKCNIWQLKRHVYLSNQTTSLFHPFTSTEKEIGMVSPTSSSPREVLCPSVSVGFVLYSLQLCSAPAKADGSPNKQSNVYLSCKAFMCIVAVMSLKRFHIDSDCVETDYIGDGQSNDLKWHLLFRIVVETVSLENNGMCTTQNLPKQI